MISCRARATFAPWSAGIFKPPGAAREEDAEAGAEVAGWTLLKALSLPVVKIDVVGGNDIFARMGCVSGS